MLLSDFKFHIENIKLRFTNPKNVFSEIYQKQLWGNSPSVSGTGSDLKQTRKLQQKIPKILRKYKIKSMLDAPCGDFYWLKNVKLPNIKYFGMDIVEDIINKNILQYIDINHIFLKGNIILDTLPKADLILCRDCLVHFSYSDIKKTLKNFQRSGAKYLLTTTFPKHPQNPNIPTGRWRPIDLQAKPFNFPKPIEIFEEGCTELNGEFKDKSVALWYL